MSTDSMPIPAAPEPDAFPSDANPSENVSTAPAVALPATVGPIASNERILYIDSLRGMALFGIIAASMRGFNAPVDLYGNIRPLFHARPDLIAQGFIDIFIQGKFVTLFSFLFGLG